MADACWARVSLMGHTVLYGLASGEERYGVTGLRLDVPETAIRPAQVQWYAPGALFGVVELSEEDVLKYLAEEPPWGPAPTWPALRAYVEDQSEDDGDGPDEGDGP